MSSFANHIRLGHWPPTIDQQNHIVVVQMVQRQHQPSVYNDGSFHFRSFPNVHQIKSQLSDKGFCFFLVIDSVVVSLVSSFALYHLTVCVTWKWKWNLTGPQPTLFTFATRDTWSVLWAQRREVLARPFQQLAQYNWEKHSKQNECLFLAY